MLNLEYRERQTDYLFRLARLTHNPRILAPKKHNPNKERRAPKQNTETVFCTQAKKFRQGSAAEKIIDGKKIAVNKNGTPMVCKEKMVEARGFEPRTFCLQSRRSTN